VPDWVCLLRAVNLGKQRKLPMAALRAALTAAGLTNVRTYLQSGNIFAGCGAQARDEVCDLVRGVIATGFGMDVPVIARTPAELAQVIAANPFPEQAAQRPHLIRVIFLAAPPPPAAVARLRAGPVPPETCRVAGEHVYVDYVGGYHATARTAGYFTRVLGVDGTERNWRTLLALAELCSADTSAPGFPDD
jgi:uncharacterized protein (DUF1697 family)